MGKTDIWKKQSKGGGERFGHFFRKCHDWLTQTQALLCKTLQLAPCRELGTTKTMQGDWEQRETKRHEYIRKNANWTKTQVFRFWKPFLSLLSLPSSGYNLLLFLSFHVLIISSLLRSIEDQCPIFPAFQTLSTLVSGSHWSVHISTCAPYLLNLGQTGPTQAPCCLLLSPRQGVLAWLYPSEQQPGLSPAQQIDSVCVSSPVANANTVHLLILIHPPSTDI